MRMACSRFPRPRALVSASTTTLSLAPTGSTFAVGTPVTLSTTLGSADGNGRTVEAKHDVLTTPR